MRHLMLAGAVTIGLMIGPAWADVDAGVDAFERGDYDTAYREWYSLAIQGDALAQYNLGVGYYYYYKQNYPEAAKWIRPSAEKGLAAAQHDLGSMYYLGKGVREDFAQAAHWYRLSAEQGLPMGQYNLGALYYAGQGVPQNFKLAATWFFRAVKAGVPMAKINLGTMYEKGLGVRQDYAEAVKWYRLAAEQSVVSALKSTGLFEESGGSLPGPNAEIYTLMVEQALAAGKYNLGGMYARGLGVPQDYVKAYMWWTLARAQGDDTAKEMLERFAGYMTRSEVAEAKQLAVEWWARAMEPHRAVRNNLIEKPKFTSAFKAFDARGYFEAFKLFKDFAEQGDAAAQNNVGVLYESSTGVYRSDRAAEQWYRKAAEQGLPEAQYNLAAILAADLMAGKEGDDAEENQRRFIEAYTWLTLAAAQDHPDAAEGVRRMRKHMTPYQIGEAQRRVWEWQPTE